VTGNGPAIHSSASETSNTKEYAMDQYAVLVTLMRQARDDSPENARRREQLLWLEQQTREARRRRRREHVRRAWTALTAFRRTPSNRRTRRIDAPDLR
jgi:hypothetical protein